MPEPHDTATPQLIRRLLGGWFAEPTLALEAVVRILERLPPGERRQCTSRCCDWKPLAATLSFAPPKVRQNFEAMLLEALRIIDCDSFAITNVIPIKPEPTFGRTC